MNMNIKKWVIENLKPNATILEAGVCDGIDTLFFSNHFVNGIIYGFEPIPDLFKIAQEKLINKDNVKLFNLALSDKNGFTKIYKSDRFGVVTGSSSILKPQNHLEVHPEITFKEEIDIETKNLDDWCVENDVKEIDFMWLDMQGVEPIVLMNSPNILKNIKYLFTEVSLIETYENVILYPEYKQFLEDNGFEIIKEELPWIDMGNVLFVNKKWN